MAQPEDELYETYAGVLRGAQHNFVRRQAEAEEVELAAMEADKIYVEAMQTLAGRGARPASGEVMETPASADRALVEDDARQVLDWAKCYEAFEDAVKTHDNVSSWVSRDTSCAAFLAWQGRCKEAWPTTEAGLVALDPARIDKAHNTLRSLWGELERARAEHREAIKRAEGAVKACSGEQESNEKGLAGLRQDRGEKVAEAFKEALTPAVMLSGLAGCAHGCFSNCSASSGFQGLVNGAIVGGGLIVAWTVGVVAVYQMKINAKKDPMTLAAAEATKAQATLETLKAQAKEMGA